MAHSASPCTQLDDVENEAPSPAEVEAWMKKSYIRVRERAMRTAGAAEADIMPVEAAAQLYHCYAKRRRS